MIFRAIFDEMLPDKDLVECENRERLPSPEELSGRIILKGSYQQKKVVYASYIPVLLSS